jgi:tripartite-type tricarboxylate transporter receptor subunit TctC
MRTILATLLALIALGAQAQEYPTRPITMIVPFPPGGVADIVGRPLAAAMGKTLGQPVVVVNRAGAGGANGMTPPARADADGDTNQMARAAISNLPVADTLNGKDAP